MRTNQLTFLTAAIIPLTYLSGNWSAPPLGNPTLIKSATGEVYASVLLLLYLLSQKPDGKFQLPKNLTIFVAVIFFVYISLSVFWSQNLAFFIDAWLRWFAAAVTFGFAILIARTPAYIPVIIQIMVISAVLVASIGLAQQYLDWNYLFQTAKPGSTFANRNLAGHVIVICLPLAFFRLLLQDSSLRDKVLSFAAILVLTLYGYHTTSTNILISITVEMMLFGCFLFWLYLQKPRTLSHDIFVIASLLTLVGIIFFLPLGKTGTVVEIFRHAIYESLPSLIVTQYGIGSRLDIWAIAWSIFRESPIVGIGLGNFYEVCSNGYVNHSNLLGLETVHNDPLEIAADLGLIGFALFIFLFILIIRSGLRLFAHSDDQIRLMSALILCALAGFSVNSLASFPLQLMAPLASVALLSGVLVGTDNASWKSVVATRLTKSSIKFVGISAATVILLSSMYLNFHWLKDIDNLSTQYSNRRQLTPWQTSSTFVNPNIINSLRVVVRVYLKHNYYRQANSFVSTLMNIWPDEPFNLLLAAEVNLNLGRLATAEKMALKLKDQQPNSSLSAEHYLLTIYSKQNDLSQLRNIYSQLRQLEKEQLKADPRNIIATHCLSILFEDHDTTKIMFQLYAENFPQNNIVEANMAVFYANIEEPEKAYELAQHTLAESDDFRNTLAFKKILAKEPISKPLQPFRREALEQLKKDPTLYLVEYLH